MKREFMTCFTGADVNQDGRLCRSEYMDFLVKEHASKAARNVPSQDPANMSEEKFNEMYDGQNAINQGEEGVSVRDMITYIRPYARKFAELKAQPRI